MFNGIYYTLLYYFLGLTYYPEAQPRFLFLPISVFQKKEYQTESKRNDTFGRAIFVTEAIQETWGLCQGSFKEATRQGGAPPPSWAPRGSLGPLLSPIYVHIP